MDTTKPNEALQRAISRYPTLRAFADVLGVRYQVVQQWLANRVPAEHCPTIERLTCGDSTCEQLRSDVDWAVLRNSSYTSESVSKQVTPKKPTKPRQKDPEQKKTNRINDSDEQVRATSHAGGRQNPSRERA